VKGYEKYLPDKKNKTSLVQAQVDENIRQQVKAILDREGWTWHDFITGLLMKFLDEAKRKSA